MKAKEKLVRAWLNNNLYKIPEKDGLSGGWYGTAVFKGEEFCLVADLHESSKNLSCFLVVSAQEDVPTSIYARDNIRGWNVKKLLHGWKERSFEEEIRYLDDTFDITVLTAKTIMREYDKSVETRVRKEQS